MGTWSGPPQVGSRSGGRTGPQSTPSTPISHLVTTGTDAHDSMAAIIRIDLC